MRMQRGRPRSWDAILAWGRQRCRARSDMSADTLSTRVDPELFHPVPEGRCRYFELVGHGVEVPALFLNAPLSGVVARFEN